MTLEMVRVRWVDSESLDGGGWKTFEEFEEFVGSGVVPIVSVGLVWRKGEHDVVLVQSVSRDCVSEFIKVPIAAIVDWEFLGSVVVGDG